MLDLSILMLEDDIEQQHAFRSMLRPHGHWVDIVPDGVDAVFRYRERLESRRQPCRATELYHALDSLTGATPFGTRALA